MHVEHVHLDALRPWKRNARTHSKKQVRQIADAISEFGFVNPVIVDGGTMSENRGATTRPDHLAAPPRGRKS